MSHASSFKLDRRAFLRCAADTCACVIGVQTLTNDQLGIRSSSLRIGIAVIGRKDAYAMATLGIELGLDEATRAASLLGGAVDVVGRADTIANTSALVRRERLSVLLCAANADDTVEIGRACESVNTPLFNLSAADDSLRNQRCSRLTFHVCASDAMQRAALDATNSSVRTDATIEVWNDRLERFGAAQLNDRFRSRFRRPMDSLAWTGWFAMKVAWESSLRARSTDGSATAAYLERETAQFDGQKGVPLSFRRWDRQLRQPVYVVTASKPTEPIPIPTSASASRQELDALGTSEEASTCHRP